jgi:hypothetical protein
MSLVSEIKMPMGKAIIRLNTLHSRLTRGLATKIEKEEHDLIRDALNKTELSLGFDCDGDGEVDITVDNVFYASASTSCCRLIDLPPQRPQVKRRRKSTKQR